MTEKFSLKDHLFNKTKVTYLASLLTKADKKFKAEAFVADVMSKLLELELKDRIRWIAAVLKDHLPADYEKALGVIIKALPPPLDPTKTDDDFGEFILAPFGEYVAQNGVTKDRLDVSLEAIKELTKRFSMEDSIRYFLRAFPKETLKVMKAWAKDENYHVRRLVSEGTRPLLPWSGRVPLSTADTLPLLNTLHADKTRYVTRSVANHLNDIAKKEPAVVIETLKLWQRLGKQKEAELNWMIKHALRTRIKMGDRETLALLGYAAEKPKQVSLTVSPTEVFAGGVCLLAVDVVADRDTNLLIDYRIHFQKKNGTSVPKVFKWKTVSAVSGEVVRLEKRHTLKADATTFTLYPGEHIVDVQINGQICTTSSFVLKIK
jgi:3-methyladenine DNA glycosylase AlkC